MAVFCKAIKSFTAERHQAGLTNRVWSLIDHRFIDEVGIHERLGHGRSAFDKNAGDPSMSESLQGMLRIDHSKIVDRNRNDLRTAVLKWNRVGLGLVRST